MIPIAMLVYFMKQYILKSLGGTTSITGEELGDSDLDDDDDDDKDKVMLFKTFNYKHFLCNIVIFF